MTRPRVATRDPALGAVVVARTPLHYATGADDSMDRPAQVRAGSSLARVPGGIALVQDDANFVAVVDPDSLRVRAIPLPAGVGGRRLFDDRRGNKAHKLDLEACVAIDSADGDTLLLALGSGSTPARESIAIVGGWDADDPRATLVHVPHLYETLRREQAFAGSELNVEGAVLLGERLRLFGRGNGAPRAGVRPLNATCDLSAPALLAHLDDPDRTPPAPLDVVPYELGVLDGIALGFTDAAPFGGAVLYTATAEDSPDAVRDGRVSGSAVGIIDDGGRTRWAPLTDAEGRLLAAKVEGVVAPDGPKERVLVVVDADDPDAASELWTIELRGEW